MYRRIYPEFSVATGVIEAKLAKLLWILGNGAAARRHAKQALTHLEKLAPESTLIVEARNVLSQAPPAPAEIQPAEIEPAEIQPAGIEPAEIAPTEIEAAHIKPAVMEPALMEPPELQLFEPAEIQIAEIEPAVINPAAEPKCGNPIAYSEDAPTADSEEAATADSDCTTQPCDSSTSSREHG
jgi:hypothetical protein